MRTELPELKRCCFCLPLRYGLLTWGYLKLVAGIFLTIAAMMTLYNLVEMIIVYKNSYHGHYILVMCLVLAIIVTDVVLNIIFIIGGHKKNVKLLRVYYIYSLVIWGLTTVGVLLLVFLMMPVSPGNLLSFRMYLLILDLASIFVYIIMQSYFILLLRSEIIKLSNNCEFRFVNNAAEAECTMKYKEGIAREGDDDICEKETGDGLERRSCEKICEKNLTNGDVKA